MGSHSVTCHPAAVTFPPLSQPKLALDLVSQEGCKAELTEVVVTSQDSVPAKDGHLSQYTKHCLVEIWGQNLCSRTTKVHTWTHASNGIDKIIIDSRLSLTNHFPADWRRRRWRYQELLVTFWWFQIFVFWISSFYWRLHTTIYQQNLSQCC